MAEGAAEKTKEPPEDPQAIALTDISDLRNQMSGFEQFSQESFHALNTQVAQLTSQLAQDNSELKLEVGALAEKLAFAQQSIYQLEDQLQTLFSTQVKAELETTISDSVSWMKRTGQLLSSSKLQESLVGLKKYATEIANGALVNKETQPYTLEGAGVQLTSKKSGEPEELNEDIAYLMRFAVAKGWQTGAVPTSVANTTFWAEGSRAYAQLMLENQSHLTPANIAGLKGLEQEGVTLGKAQSPWSAEAASAEKTKNPILDGALETFEQAASGKGVEGTTSVAEPLEVAEKKSFENSLKSVNYGGTAGNPTDIDLWGGLNQTYNGLKVFNQFYPALHFANGELIPVVLMETLPRAVINGVRLGLIGKKGATTDSVEVEIEGSGQPLKSECTKLKLYDTATKGAFYEGPCTPPNTEVARQEIESAELRPDEALISRQAEVCGASLEAFEKEGQAPAKKLAGARALVQSYLKLGMPQSLSSDPVLESDIEGTGAQFLDPEPGNPRSVPEEITAKLHSCIERPHKVHNAEHGESVLEELEKETQDDAIGAVATRSKAWVTQIEEQVKPYVEGKAQEFTEHKGEKCSSEECGKVNEQSPLIESTINRIQLTRDVLNESSPPGAETLAPTNVGSSEATVNGEVAPNEAEIESCEFEYGASEPHGHTVECEPIPKSTEKAALVSAHIKWPTAGGSFHERLVVKTWGGTSYGEDIKVQLAQSSVESAHGPVLASTPTPGITIEMQIEEPPHTSLGLPSGVTTPVGLLSFLITHVPNENRSVPVRIQLPVGEDPTALYMLKHVQDRLEFTEVPSADYTITGNVINVTLTDGGSDDLDGEANGTIEAGLAPVTATTPTGPSVTTTTTAAIGSRNAILEGTVNPNGHSVTSCQFTVERLSSKLPTHEEEKTVPCAAGPGSGHEPVPVTAIATELSPGDEYSFVLKATNASGSATSTPPGEFTTTTLPGPTVTTGEVTGIYKRKALLHGTVNPNGIAVTKCWATIQEVEGEMRKLGFACNTAVGTGRSPTAVVVKLIKLYPGHKYTFQLFAENAEGGQGAGLAGEFQTGGTTKHKR